MYNKKDVTLVTVNWNQLPALTLMLKTFVAYHGIEELKNVFVIDNGSSDGSVEFLENNEISSLLLSENIGHENAINLIYPKIKTKYALFLDTDIEFFCNVFEKYLPFLNDTCKLAGDYITGDQLNEPVKPRVGAWFMLTDIASMKEKGVNTFRDKEDWSYDVGSQYAESVLQHGFTIHHIPRLNKDIDHELISMRYDGFNHIGKVSWDIPLHMDREFEVFRRRKYIVERLKLFENVYLKR